MLCCAINALRAGTHCSSLCNRHCYPPVLQIKVWAQGGCCAAKKCRCGIPKRATLQTALVQTLAWKFHPSIDAQAPPRPTPQCSRLSQSDSVSRIASLLSSQCLPLPFVIAGNYLSKGGSFLYWGFLQSCSAASSDKREAPAPGSLSRIHVLVCSLHSRQLPGPGRRPNKSPAPHHSESPGTLHGTLTPSKQDSSQVQSHRGLCLVNVGT